RSTFPRELAPRLPVQQPHMGPPLPPNRLPDRTGSGRKNAGQLMTQGGRIAITKLSGLREKRARLTLDPQHGVHSLRQPAPLARRGQTLDSAASAERALEQARGGGTPRRGSGWSA